MVAHEQEIDEVRNIPGWTPHVCWHNFKDPARWPAVLQGSWIRPEDLHHYKELFPVVKLATRMHSRPRAVVEAYIEEKYYGNLLDLFEPGFSPAFAPYVLDNPEFPKGLVRENHNLRPQLRYLQLLRPGFGTDNGENRRFLGG